MQALKRRPIPTKINIRRYRSEFETWDFFLKNEHITQEQYNIAMDRYQRKTQEEVTFLPKLYALLICLWLSLYVLTLMLALLYVRLCKKEHLSILHAKVTSEGEDEEDHEE